MFVKICGLTEPASIAAAIDAGADALGFVFAESVREIDPRAARRLCEAVPETVLRVAVMRHPSAARFTDVITVFAPDWVQADAADFRTLPASAAERLPVFRDDDVTPAGTLPPRLLFESGRSGSGALANWDKARKLARSSDLILAGGLDAGNVADAVGHVRPYGVDVSSGVESSRGIKDPAKIREFIARVRSLENDE